MIAFALLVFLSTQPLLAQQLFADRCAGCHGEEARVELPLDLLRGRPPYEDIYLPALTSGHFTEESVEGSLRVLRRKQ